MDGELHNYCQMMSRVSGEDPLKILQDVSDETVAVAKRAATILKDIPAALKAFKEYEQGYMLVCSKSMCSHFNQKFQSLPSRRSTLSLAFRMESAVLRVKYVRLIYSLERIFIFMP